MRRLFLAALIGITLSFLLLVASCKTVASREQGARRSGPLEMTTGDAPTHVYHYHRMMRQDGKYLELGSTTKELAYDYLDIARQEIAATVGWADDPATARVVTRRDAGGIGAINGPGLYASPDPGVHAPIYGTLLVVIPLKPRQTVATDRVADATSYKDPTGGPGMRSKAPVYLGLWDEVVMRGADAIDWTQMRFYNTENLDQLAAKSSAAPTVPPIAVPRTGQDALDLAYSGKAPLLYQLLNETWEGADPLKDLTQIDDLAVLKVALKFTPKAVITALAPGSDPALLHPFVDLVGDAAIAASVKPPTAQASDAGSNTDSDSGRDARDAADQGPEAVDPAPERNSSKTGGEGSDHPRR